MKIRNILMSVALCAASINCFAANPEGEYTFIYQGKLELLNTTTPGATKTIFNEPMGTRDGEPAVYAAQNEKSAFEQIKEGNKTITRSVPQVFGHRFILTPEKLTPGQFETTGRINTTISIDQRLKNKDGKPVKYSNTKNVSLATGETVTLNWVNEGETYRLTVKLNEGTWKKF